MFLISSAQQAGLTDLKKDMNCPSKKFEAKSVDSNSTAVTEWKSKLQTYLTEYEPQNIYNADETGLFFRMVPDKTLEFKDVQCHGGKMSKDRLTVMVCANMTGSEKVPLFVTGKSKNPCCFKNLKTMPIEYDANKKACVTSEIFTNWVKKFDRRILAQSRRVLLIVDNCPAHPEIAGLRSVKLVFLPPNTTSLTQPMDQGVIKNLKAHYRKQVIQQQLRAIETG
ncbi:tigger transposable element-derived protein 4-like [Ruditapes philippinarum]|uniref:tigger transposable element-derived protein 4-like n=1 Tax=Ruditapes philippinarum TaxID=129788 RepID=UPI00295BCA19|nr:tigger transposable element-derived protein 4-like [Ruditapes philippinarum]